MASLIISYLMCYIPTRILVLKNTEIWHAVCMCKSPGVLESVGLSQWANMVVAVGCRYDYWGLLQEVKWCEGGVGEKLRLSTWLQEFLTPKMVCLEFWILCSVSAEINGKQWSWAIGMRQLCVWLGGEDVRTTAEASVRVGNLLHPTPKLHQGYHLWDHCVQDVLWLDLYELNKS